MLMQSHTKQALLTKYGFNFNAHAQTARTGNKVRFLEFAFNYTVCGDGICCTVKFVNACLESANNTVHQRCIHTVV